MYRWQRSLPTRYGALHLVRFHISISDGNSRVIHFFSGEAFILCLRCGKVKDENILWMCAPTWVAEGDFSTMLRCYEFFMRLCQFPLFSPSPGSDENLWLQFSCLGSIALPGVLLLLLLFVDGGGGREVQNSRENFVESFLSGLWFPLDSFACLHGYVSNGPCVHFIIKKFGWRKIEWKLMSLREQIVVGMFLHLPFNLSTAKCCLI